MKYSFHPAAENELYQAVNYYNRCQDNLGLEFAKEVYSSIQSILAFPQTWTPLSKNTRRGLVNRFPCGIIYNLSEKEIFLIALIQLNKKPGYWKSRL